MNFRYRFVLRIIEEVFLWKLAQKMQRLFQYLLVGKLFGLLGFSCPDILADGVSKERSPEMSWEETSQSGK